MAKKPVAKKKAAPARKSAAAKPAKRGAAASSSKKKASASTAASAKKAVTGLFKPVKQSVTIRLDSDVVSWFKKKADKYQTEINSVLRGHASKRGL